MQIRLTVVDPLAPAAPARGRAASCDVLVTAPAGTALAAVASALASAVSGGDGPVVLYAGTERLDDRRSTLGEPPLIDGAVLSLGAPAAPEPHPELDDAPTQLHVVAGPDAGGVHLLHGGEIRIGRSADADVPLDDPDVSRLHCAVTVSADGRVSVADLGSTNGTTLDGSGVTTRPVRFAPGALLRIGESTLRLAPAGGPGARVRTEPDGEGHVRVPAGDGRGGDPRPGGEGPAVPAPRDSAVPHARARDGSNASTASGGLSAAQEHGPVEPPIVPVQGGAPRIERHGGSELPPPGPRGGDTHGAGFGVGALDAGGEGHAATGAGHPSSDGGGTPAGGGSRKGTPLRGTDVPPGVRRRGGLTAWARRLTGGRAEQGAARRGTYDDGERTEATEPRSATNGPRLPEAWPDPASLLLTALGPGPRLWERAPGHPEALTVRLGTADRAAPDGSGLLPAVPVTADLREVGALGLAGPRERLAGLARAVIAQLAALHSPDALEIVLISADRSRPLEERTAEWAWLGWLPHIRPGHGQDCRLLLAYDREQATARVEELLRRLEDVAHEARGGTAGGRPVGTGSGGAAPTGPGSAAAAARDSAHGSAGTASAVAAQGSAQSSHGPGTAHLESVGQVQARGAVRRPSWARDDDPADGADGFPGPYSVVVVDGDPGGADVREAMARLALEGPRAGIHVVCLAETAAASPASPVTETYEAACTVSPVFRECGAVALLSGDVATALRLMRVARAGVVTRNGAGTAAGAAAAASEGSVAGARARTGAAGQSRAADSARAGGGAGAAGGGAETFPRLADGSRRGADASRADVGGGRGSAAHDAVGHSSVAGGSAGHFPVDQGTVAHGPVDHQPIAHTAAEPSPAGHGTAGNGPSAAPTHGPVGHGTVATVDAVSLAWAERFARALAPLRTEGTGGERHARVSVPLPQAARLLDELGLARATPASLMARWADAGDDKEALGGRACAVLGAGPRGPVGVDLGADGPHLLIEGPPGSGRTELLRAVVASLAAAERPDRLSVVLIDGRDSTGSGGGHGDGLRVCTDVPHVTTHLTANDPVRMREFAQSLSAELKRRAELLGRSDFTEWHTGRELSGRMVAQRAAGAGVGVRTGARGTGGVSGAGGATGGGATGANGAGGVGAGDLTGDLDTPPSSTIRLRPGAARRQAEAVPPLPRLVVVVDDLDALISPALGSPGRPAAGSVIRALEAVAREGERLGVHLVAAAGIGGRTAESEPARRATLRVTLDAVTVGPDEPAPGRGRLAWADGRTVPFQGGRVTGRIPRTATLRPTVVPLEWHRMGDPPARRPVRELGNGPTDLALLASALERAAREVAAAKVPSLL
ncbi:FHA domain-containing protein [Streptomyces sp. CA-251387]|uniref:FHA domain-containing protein n=1 Tax=Streptomyces sp. CA-251387 TaxID=3240064 RepID=UPI003D9171E7